MVLCSTLSSLLSLFISLSLCLFLFSPLFHPLPCLFPFPSCIVFSSLFLSTLPFSYPFSLLFLLLSFLLSHHLLILSPSLSLSLPFSTIPLPSVASSHTCRTGAFLLSGSSHPAPGMTFVQSHSVDPRYLDEMPTRTVSWHAKSVLLWFLVVPGQVWNYTNQDKQRFTSFGYPYNTPDSKSVKSAVAKLLKLR